MKILLVNDRLNLEGGAEVYLWAVAKGFRDLGHEVAVIGGVSLGRAKVPSGTEGIDVRCVPDLWVDELGHALADISPDVVYLQSIDHPQVIGYFTARGPTVRFVHDHCTYCPGTAKYWFSSRKICRTPLSPWCFVRAFTRRCMSRNPLVAGRKLTTLPRLLQSCRRLDKIVVASEYVKSQLLLNGLEDERVIVNPLFGFKEQSVEFIGPRYCDPPVVLFVGRIFIEKGVEYLLRASRQINMPHQVRIVGDGWDLKRLKALVDRLDLGRQVEFLGWLDRESIQQEYENSYLVVIPSMWPEPFGMVGIEAMSFGKPVVGYPSGGIIQWLREGENGLTAEYGSVGSLAEAITRLLKDKSLAERLGKRGFELAQREFTLARHLDRLEEMFEDILV